MRVVRRVPTNNPALLRYLGEMGVLPGAEISILAQVPFDRTVRIRRGAGRLRTRFRARNQHVCSRWKSYNIR